MRLTFLGTSAGTPTKTRNVTALVLAVDDQEHWYLIDCGEATQHRLLHCRYSLSQLTTIFITHTHGDHIFGLPGLISSAVMQGRKAPLTICAPTGVEGFVRQALATAAQDQPFELIFLNSDEPGFSYNDNTVSVTSHELSHRVPCFAYRFKEQQPPNKLDTEKMAALSIPQGPLWGLLQQGENITLENGQLIAPEQVTTETRKQRVVIVGGDNDKPELLEDIMSDANLLVHEATFTEAVLQKMGNRWMHSSARQVAESAARAQLPHLILTHFSGRYTVNNKRKNSITLLKEEAQHYYQGQIELAEDFAIWQLKRSGELIPLGYCNQ